VYLGDATGTSGQQVGFDAVRWHYLGTGVEREPGSARITGETRLNPLAPNPLREGAEVSFSLETPSGNVSLGVYDVSGRKIRSLCEGYQPAGEHRIFWNARDDRGQRVPGGVFFLRLNAGGKELTQRAVVLR
jgi:flagellar hook assembly protein FlgD